MPPKNTPLAALIRARRTARALTMQQLAERIGVTKSNVHVWESGEYVPKPAVLGKLAEALAVSEEDLFALAGYARPTGLPTYSPYFRLKYGHLPEDAIRELEAHMAEIEQKHGGDDADRA